jgi:hypothetical protein
MTMEYQTIPEQTEPKRIARWESKGGKYWVDLYFNPCFHLANGTDVIDAHYRGDNCSGPVTCIDELTAIIAMQARVDRGYFQADANKTPMHRVKVTL